MILGILSDWLIKTDKLSLNVLRKTMSAIATYGPALSLVGLAFTKCDPTMAVVWMTLALTLDGAMCSGYNVNALDLSPNYAGSIRAFSSVVANATGFLAPTVVSFIIEGKVKHCILLILSRHCYFGIHHFFRLKFYQNQKSKFIGVNSLF